MVKTIQTISECRKLIREVNEQVRKANESEGYTYADAEREGKIRIDKDGNIDCRYLDLKSLKGAPKVVKGDFWCSVNRLKSLEGAPEYVGGSFDCHYNQLKSLEGAPKEVGGSFDCRYNRLTSLEGTSVQIKKELRKISSIGGKIFIFRRF